MAVTPQRTRAKPAMSDDDKEGRRREIVAAAKQVFAKKGFSTTKMADVANVAGLSYGSLYSYFDSKEALFRGVLEQEGAAIRQHVLTIAFIGETPVDLEAVVRRATAAVLEYFEHDSAAAKILFRDSYALGERLERHLFDIYERFIDDIELLITEAQRRRIIIPGPPRVIAFSVAALLGQLAFRRLRTDDGLDAKALGDFVATMLIGGLRPPPLTGESITP
jgi:AcrR family transcriptional regulator